MVIDRDNLLDQVKAMKELDLHSFLLELAEHMYKNGTYHVAEQALDLDRIGQENEILESQNNDLQDDVLNLEAKISEIGMMCVSSESFKDVKTLKNYLLEIKLKTIL